MKRALKKIIYITLIIALFMSINSIFFTKDAFAETVFTDMTSAHWAYNYVKEMASLNIVNGFPDGSFKPESPVTKEESLTMIYRTLEKSSALKSKDDFTEEYKDLLTQYNIADWAKPYIAYGLKKDIISQNELAYFCYEGLGVPASREEIAIWTAKSIAKPLSPIVDLSLYDDMKSISTEALPYVDMLYRYKIMTGDNNSNFRPNSTITRAEFATICYRTVPLVNDSSISIEKNGETYKGTIEDLKGNVVSMKDKNNLLREIMFFENKGIIVNGMGKSLSYLKKGETATISYNNVMDENTVIIDTVDEVNKGKITSIENIAGNDFKVMIQNDKGQQVSLWMNEQSDVYDVNSKEISPIHLTFNNNILYTCDGIKILELQIFDL